MTAEQLTALVAVGLSLAFGYIPGLKDWYEKLSSPQKASLMGLLLVVSAVGSLAYTCQFAAECLSANWQQYAGVLLEALKANVATYVIAVRPFQK